MNHTGPSIRFYLSHDMYQQTMLLLDKIDAAEKPESLAGDLGDLVNELAASGLDYYFLQPLRLAKVGIFTMKTAEMGMSASTKVVGPIIRKVVRSLDAHQLRVITKFMRSITAPHV